VTLRLLVLASAAMAVLGAAPARADQPVVGTVLRQGWIGAEVAPLSFNQGSGPRDHPSRVQPGVGLTLRLFRHRWLNGPYWTPVQVGGFFGWGADGDWTFFVGAQTEVGGVLRIGDQVLELGVGLGGGILGIRHGKINTYDLGVGGIGWMASPVARYLFREAHSHTLGLVVRAQIPVSSLPPQNTEVPVSYDGRGMLFLLAFDVGVGRG
jgi:hypothetical protein